MRRFNKSNHLSVLDTVACFLYPLNVETWKECHKKSLLTPEIALISLNQNVKWKGRKIRSKTMLLRYHGIKKAAIPSREPFKMEINITFLACRHIYSWPPQPPAALCIKGNSRSPQQFFLCAPLWGYPQWKELLLPVLKHQLGSLRLGAVCGERGHSQLVIATLWGFLLQRSMGKITF